MRRPRQQTTDRASASRETILDGAFQTFAKNGYRDTAMDDIAAAAEISKGGIYFHFPTKESIFRELMRTTAAKLDSEGRVCRSGRKGPHLEGRGCPAYRP